MRLWNGSNAVRYNSGVHKLWSPTVWLLSRLHSERHRPVIHPKVYGFVLELDVTMKLADSCEMARCPSSMHWGSYKAGEGSIILCAGCWLVSFLLFRDSFRFLIVSGSPCEISLDHTLVHYQHRFHLYYSSIFNLVQCGMPGGQHCPACSLMLSLSQRESSPPWHAW